jgi:hypothetical protein
MSASPSGLRVLLAWFASATPILGSFPACGEQAPGPPQVCRLDEPEGPACLQRVDSPEAFEAIAKGGLATKFMLPARDDAELLPPLLQNSRRWELHIEFLRAAFPERYGDLGWEDYLALVMRRATRDYFAGGIVTLEGGDQACRWGYTIWTDLIDPAEQLAQAEVRAIHHALAGVMLLPGLAYAPTDAAAIATARSWLAPDFPVCLRRDEVQVEVYTAGVAYGRVRSLALADLEDALRRGALDYRDVLVLDRVPVDIEAVVAAVVTGGRQWELSHVNVRMNRRGTPNLYVRDAQETLAEHAGRLVRLEAIRGLTAGGDRLRVSPASQAEAEAWWAEHRPRATGLEPADPSVMGLPGLLQMQGELPLMVRRYGGKAANLAALFRSLPTAHQVPGLGVPVGWFEEFMAATRAARPGGGTESLRERVARLEADERMRTDPAYRREALWDLRARILHAGQIPVQRLHEMAGRLFEVFGDPFVKVRFRSSSNVEDALEFSGAGLYESTSVCLADDLDADRDGPSLCDPGQGEERGMERGLRRVWASLYSERAWAERDWYQIPQSLASMGLLVSLAFPDERANGVAFTGNPDHPEDGRYLINAQIGDQSVVGNDPALVPEKNLLRMVDGRVDGIQRARASALSPPGEHVLTDAQLRELGGVMAALDAAFPVELGAYQRHQVLLDLEFKVDGSGRLRLKQIRPFLDRCRGLRCATPPPPVCLDADTLQTYSAFGSCDPILGSCRYEPRLQTCPAGCLEGACR